MFSRPPAVYKEEMMHYYIYELLEVPCPEDEWATPYDINEHPDAFPIADSVDNVEDREDIIARFGAWLEENRLGTLDGEMFIIDEQAAARYFEGRFTAFQTAISALQELNETQFIHDHDQVGALIDKLGEAFTKKYGDYVLWGCDMPPMPLEEFLRKAQSGTRYYIGAVLDYSC